MSAIDSVNINKTQTGKRVLVAPLDWGLGHATRCVPIIKELIAQGFHVLIAAEGACAALLRDEFPSIEILPLKGYRVRYSKIPAFFFLKMLAQYSKIRQAIKNEKRWLEQIIREKRLDIVISDNRFGLHSKNARCIFITHQLQIKTGNRLLDRFAQRGNYTYLANFHECLVPDLPEKENFAGDMSHPNQLPPIPVKYIGPLSRFTYSEVPKTIDLLVLISGPEPQRTVFENILLKQLQNVKLKTVLFRGLPGDAATITAQNPNVTIFNHLPAHQLNQYILSAKLVVARAGYSTIMDLAVLRQKAVLVPTPAQTEQEWLAAYLSNKKYFVTAAQKDFDLCTVMEKMRSYRGNRWPEINPRLLENAIVALR